MPLSGRWFCPGPVEVHPDVMEAMLRPVFHHRSDHAQALLHRVQPVLRSLFRTSRPVLMQTATATAMMEAAIRNGVKERVLCVVGGTFGERFADIAERCDKEVIRLGIPRGGVLEPQQLLQLLDGPPVDSVTLVHAESSTGALAPLEQLVPLFRRMADVVVIVDAVGSIGATAVETDRWGIDFLLAGSQKALGLPPGIAFGVASDRFLARAESSETRGRYLDIPELHRSALEERFPQTPAVPLFHALDVQIGRIMQEGIVAREARHRAMREEVERWVSEDGRLGFLAPHGRRADAVSALRLPTGLSAMKLVTELARGGWTISTGMDGDRERVIRIGHLGDLLPGQVHDLLIQLGETLSTTLA